MDLVGPPPIIANRALRRQPLNILHVSKHLKLRQKQTQLQRLAHPSTDTSTDPSDPFTDPSTDTSHQQQSDHRQFEDPLPVMAFVTGRSRRTLSEPYQN